MSTSHSSSHSISSPLDAAMRHMFGDLSILSHQYFHPSEPLLVDHKCHHHNYLRPIEHQMVAQPGAKYAQKLTISPKTACASEGFDTM
jgi:hypothetical protein